MRGEFAEDAAYGQGPRPENYLSSGKYQVDVMRNVDETAYHPGKLSRGDVIDVMCRFMGVGQNLDQIKKTLIYGKDSAAYEPVIGSDVHMPLAFDGPFTAIDPQIVHSIIGMATETAELIEALVKSITTGEPFDIVNFREEIGDVLWYAELGCKTTGATLEGAAWLNTKKLAARYPDKFTSERALNRDTALERSILEGDDREESFVSGSELDA